MSDLIDRQKAIDAVLSLTKCKSIRELYEYTAMYNLQNDWNGGVLCAIDKLIEVPPEEPE